MAQTATIHNPSQFDPAQYEVEDYLDNKRPKYCGGPVEGYALMVKCWEEDIARTLGPEWRRKCHRCIHCGNTNVRWITAVRHLPTNEIVVFGSDCTARLEFPDKVSFKLALLKSRADTQAKNLKAYRAKQAFLAAHPEVTAAIEEAKQPVHERNAFAHDVLYRFEQYGSLSDRQIVALVASLKRDHEYAARRVAEATEIKGDAPSGRQTVQGVVVSVQIRETDFGPTRKLLVKLLNNSKVWVTCPRSCYEAKAGDVITITATWEVSKDDKSFAFGKRPHATLKKEVQ